MGILDHLTCLLRNLYAGQEAKLEEDMKKQIASKLGKMSPCFFNLYAVYTMQNARMVNHKLESRVPGEISTTSDMQMIPLQWQKAKRN